MSLPRKCSYQDKTFNCTLPPSSIISIQEEKDEFLVGVFCERHKRVMEMKLASLLRKENPPYRQLKTQKVRFVSTECVRACITNQPTSKGSMNFNDNDPLNKREGS